MRKITFIFYLVLPVYVFGQLRTKEVTERYPNSEQIKFHYFHLKSDPKLYHGEYKAYYPSGEMSERGIFDKGEKIFYLKYNKNGSIAEELENGIISKWEYFPNGQALSVQRFKQGNKHGTWDIYRLDDCGNKILESSVTYDNGREVESKTLINYHHFGVFSTFQLIETSQYHNDTTTYKSYCTSMIRYPNEARRNGVQGKIYVKIDVSSECVFTYEILNDLGYGTAQAVEEFLEDAKRRLSNQAKCDSIHSTIPINFNLMD